MMGLATGEKRLAKYRFRPVILCVWVTTVAYLVIDSHSANNLVTGARGS